MDKSIQLSGFVRKDLLLLKFFLKDPAGEFTLSEIKQLSKNHSHHYVFEALKKFVFLGFVKEKRKGNTNIYSLNFEKNENTACFAFVELFIKNERTDVSFRNLERISEKIRNNFYILAVGGSYAEKKQLATSDLDVAIIIPVSEEKRQYEIALREGERMLPEIHGLVFTEEEFYLMLTNEEYNYGKELARKHILVTGAESYYRILFKALRHGFKG